MAAGVELREIPQDSLRAVLNLAVEPEQEPYIATNARSIAEAHFEPRGKGYGRRALELLVEEARQDGVKEMKLSYHPGEHSPDSFYTRFGFVDTCEVEAGR